MVKFAKIFIVMLLLGSGLFIFQKCSPTKFKNLPPTANGPWIAFGDSLTAGTGASEGNDYPTLLSKELDVPIQNFGVPGNTTKDGLNRIEQAVEFQPLVVLLCLGGNDGLQSLSADQMFVNLGAMIDHFHQTGSFVVLIGVRSASFRDRNEGRFKALGKQKEVLYVPNILDGVFGNPSLMSDHIHPNDAGYQVIARRLEQVLMPLVPQLKN